MEKQTVPSPLAEVKKRFGSREALIKELVTMLEDASPDLEKGLKKAPNARLLALHTTAKTVKRRFGGRQGLIEAVTKATYPKGTPPAEFAGVVNGYNMKRLYDLYQQRTAKK